MALAPYRGPSEAQSVAMAAPKTDRPHLEENWRSRSRRRRGEPPTNIDGLVAWFREQWEMELPDGLHGADVWVDRVSEGEAQDGVKAQGGSALGSPRLSPGFRLRLEASPAARDRDGDLIRPLAASLAALRHEQRYGHDVLVALTWGYFDWHDLIGQHFYLPEHWHKGGDRWCRVHACKDDADVDESRRTVVMVMPEDVLRTVIVSALTRLWYLLAAREPYITATG